MVKKVLPSPPPASNGGEPTPVKVTPVKKDKPHWHSYLGWAVVVGLLIFILLHV